MTRFERVLQIIYDNGIEYIETTLPFPLKGYYHSKAPFYPIIYVSKELAAKEKYCVALEELAHHMTKGGDGLSDPLVYGKQEYTAAKWKYEHSIPLNELAQAYIDFDANAFAMADALDVPIEYLNNAIAFYTNRYGGMVKADGFQIWFLPYFHVEKL